MIAVRVPLYHLDDVQRFRELVNTRLGKHAPNLAAFLPTGEEGSVPAEACLDMLRELHWFESEAELGTETVLVDVHSGRVVRRSLSPDELDVTGPGVLHVSGETLNMPGRRRDRGEPSAQLPALSSDHPELFRVDERPLRARQFARVLRPLAELFAAALTQGRPVCWVPSQT